MSQRSRLRGSDAALDAIAELIATVRTRASAGLVLEGAAGSGKTRLLDEAAAMASRSGLAVGRGAALAGDQLVPLGPLREALPQTPAGEALLQGLDPLADTASGLLQGLRRVFTLAAETGPLVICLDDLQWADPTTIAALEVIPDLIADLPIGLLLAANLGSVVPDMHGLGASLRRTNAWFVVPALPEEAVIAVATDVLGAPPDAELLTVARHAQGNPRELLGLLRGLQEDGLIRVEDERAELLLAGASERVRSRVRRRLDDLTPLGRQVVGVVAIFDEDCSRANVATMLQIEPPVVASAIHDLQTAALVSADLDGRLRVVDPILRQAILATLPRSGLAALRRQAAAVLLDDGAAASEVAQLMIAGARPVDALAAQTLHAAAQQIAGSDPAAAADLCSHAIGLVDYADPLRGQLTALAVTLLHAAGRSQEARAMAGRWADEAATCDEQAELLLQLSEMFTLSATRRVEANQRALELAGLSASLRARHHARVVVNLIGAGLFAQAAAALPASTETVERADDEGARSTLKVAAITLDVVHDHYTRAAAGATAFLSDADAAAGDAQREFVTLLENLVCLSLGQLEAARAGSDAGARSAEARGQMWAAVMWVHQRMRVFLALGQPREALAVRERHAGGPLVARPANVSDASALVATTQAALRIGDVELVRACEAAAEQAEAGAGAEVLRHATWILIQIAHSRGDTCGVARRLEAGRGEAMLPLYPPTPEDVVSLVRIALRAGNRTLAISTASLARDRAAENPSSGYLSGLAAHAEGLLCDDPELLAAATEQLQTSEAVLARASVLEDLGRVLLPSPESAGRGVECLDRALELYDDAGALSDGARVRRRLRDRAEHRPVVAAISSASALTDLTGAERRVVDLVASGLTNREVAAWLYVSPNTVGTHLRHAFAKLGVTSRRELVRMALDRADEPLA